MNYEFVTKTNCTLYYKIYKSLFKIMLFRYVICSRRNTKFLTSIRDILIVFLENQVHWKKYIYLSHDLWFCIVSNNYIFILPNFNLRFQSFQCHIILFLRVCIQNIIKQSIWFLANINLNKYFKEEKILVWPMVKVHVTW